MAGQQQTRLSRIGQYLTIYFPMEIKALEKGSLAHSAFTVNFRAKIAKGAFVHKNPVIDAPADNSCRFFPDICTIVCAQYGNFRAESRATSQLLYSAAQTGAAYSPVMRSNCG